MEDRLILYRVMSLGILLAVILYGTLIGLQERKKKKIKGDFIVTASLKNDFRLIFSFIWFIYSFISLGVFFVYFFEYYSFFIPQYLTKWYHLFSYKHILQVENLLLQEKDKMVYELISAYIYQSGFKSLYSGLFCLLTAAISFYFGVQNSKISSNGVLLERNLYSWNDIKEYRWNETFEKFTKNGLTKYYELELFISKKKNSKWIFNRVLKEVSVKVKSVDKEKVNNILNEKKISMKII